MIAVRQCPISNLRSRRQAFCTTAMGPGVRLFGRSPLYAALVYKHPILNEQFLVHSSQKREKLTEKTEQRTSILELTGWKLYTAPACKAEAENRNEAVGMASPTRCRASMQRWNCRRRGRGWRHTSVPKDEASLASCKHLFRNGTKEPPIPPNAPSRGQRRVDTPPY